ncbi:TMEM175 family protein [Methanosphaera sp.]
MFKLDSGRFETFIDAILAIIMTVMILKIPQPETLTITGLWNLKAMYFSYITSFIVIVSIWNNHRKLFNKVKHIDNFVITVYMILTFFITWIPYFTAWVAHFPHDLAPEISYELLFILVNISYLVATNRVRRHDAYNEDLIQFRVTPRTVINYSVFIIGFILGILVTPEFMMISCFITIITWNIPDEYFRKLGGHSNGN